MRIACISTSAVPSRTANSIQLMKVAEAMAGLGHQVRVILPGRRPAVNWLELEKHYALRHRFETLWLACLPPLKRYDFGLLAVAAGSAWRADLLYVWSLQAGALASLLGRPTLVELHDRPSGWMGPKLVAALLAGHGLRRLLLTTHSLQGWLENAYPGARGRPGMMIAPNAVDLERYDGLPAAAEARRALGLPQGFTAGYFGHLYPGRGAEMIIALAQRHPDMQFILGGGEPEAVAYWRSQAQAHNRDNVTMLGHLPLADLAQFQAACDVLLMPYGRKVAGSSGGETSATASPMKAFEYLACGRVILSTDLPVLREVLNEDNAVLLPAQDLDAWDRGLAEIRVDDRRARRLAQAARRSIEGRSWRDRQLKALEGLGDAPDG
jgi:glycosyltransferase involved in cell wall biosynthesis